MIKECVTPDFKNHAATNGYIVVTCPSCLRPIPVITRDAVIGKDAALACDYCGAEVKYHISDSALPVTHHLRELDQHLLEQRRVRQRKN